MLGYIYKFENKLNHKVYVGQTVNLAIRYARHKYDAKTKKNKFYNSVRKHGFDSFEFSVIFVAFDAKHLNELEQYFIAEYNSFYLGYNSNIGGGSAFGFRHSQYTKDMISKQKLLYNPVKGKPLSEEHKYKLAVAFTGDRNHFYGKTHTAEARLVISEANKGRIMPDWHREIMSSVNSGEGNPMYGLKRPEVGDKNKQLKGDKICYEGVVYQSRRDLAESLGKSRSVVNRLIRIGEAKLLDTTKETNDNTQNNQGT